MTTTMQHMVRDGLIYQHNSNTVGHKTHDAKCWTLVDDLTKRNNKRDVIKTGRLTTTKIGTHETFTIIRHLGSVRWHGYQHNNELDEWSGSFRSLNTAVAWIERKTGRHFTWHAAHQKIEGKE